MNPLGLDTLQRLVPVYETNLNRNFSGHAQGPLPQRIAEAAMARHQTWGTRVVSMACNELTTPLTLAENSGSPFTKSML